jgi:DinB family protein
MTMDLKQTTAILRRTPATIDALLRDLPETCLLNNEGPETWSPYDVVGHLIHGEETDWIPRVKIILEHGDTREFEPFNRVAMFKKSQGKSIAELLDTFADLRASNLRELESMNLTPELLAKHGHHPELGVVTLEQLLATWAVHDLGHIRQVVRVMAKQYSDAVGPWRAYLSILSEPSAVAPDQSRER